MTMILAMQIKGSERRKNGERIIAARRGGNQVMVKWRAIRAWIGA
jgi:hypothetical protein